MIAETIDVILSLGLSIGAVVYLIHMFDMSDMGELITKLKDKVTFESEVKYSETEREFLADYDFLFENAK